MTPRQAHLIYEFGEFRLDALRRVLSSRVDDQPLQVTGKIFDTLLFFVERSGQLLDKRVLLEALWPNVVVEESNLTQVIHTLRRVLGERPDDHRFIVTVPGRGYRFVADVTTATVAEEPQQPAKRKLLAAAAAAGIVLVGVAFWLLQGSGQPLRSASGTPRPLSIAVLPFVDMSEAQDQAYFAEGLSEEILNVLAQSTTLRVTARTSSFSFKGRNVDIPTIADTLNITHVLEGSVRRSGDRVRITAQLVEGTSSAHLWSQTYDRDVTDVFGVQDEIAMAVAQSLQVTLTGSATPSIGTRNVAAFERYLQGKYFFNRRGESDVARAREYFEQALQLDPSYARAWAGLAGVYQLARQQGLPNAQAAWRTAVDNALTLGPNLADSHVRAAQFYWWVGDRDTSEAHCKRAIALNPSDPLVLGAAAGREFARGHWSEGIALQRRAVAVDPLSAIGHSNLGAYLTTLGEWDEAIMEFGKARELSPTLNRIDSDIARVQLLRQRFDEALAATERIPAGQERDQCIALAHRAPGQKTAADAALARLIARASSDNRDPTIDVSIAEAYAFRGEEDEALKWVTRAMQGQVGRNWTREEVMQSPFLRTLHADARWHTLLARADTR